MVLCPADWDRLERIRVQMSREDGVSYTTDDVVERALEALEAEVARAPAPRVIEGCADCRALNAEHEHAAAG